MTTLVWDEVGERTYESGLDKGVLYLPDGTGVAWNGLTSMVEKFDRSVSSVYFDGMKVADTVVHGDFSGTMKAITYPEEFVELEGYVASRRGMYLGDQVQPSFGLCYRNRIGDDVRGDEAGYKIHILYNVTALPHDNTYASVSSEPTIVEFEWDVFAVPEEVPGFRPTAHVIIDTRYLDAILLSELEDILYGTAEAPAHLPPMSELVTFLNTWYSIEIIDHGDGTWTAIVHHEDLITITDGGTGFIIEEIDGEYLDADTYRVSTTVDTP